MLVCNISLETCPPKSRSNTTLKDQGVRRTLPPTFLFLLIQLSKNRHTQTQCRGLGGFWPHARSSVAYAALFEFSSKSLSRLSTISQGRTLLRQRRAALVDDRLIGGSPFWCQQGFCIFFQFFSSRQKTAKGLWIVWIHATKEMHVINPPRFLTTQAKSALFASAAL